MGTNKDKRIGGWRGCGRGCGRGRDGVGDIEDTTRDDSERRGESDGDRACCEGEREGGGLRGDKSEEKDEDEEGGGHGGTSTITGRVHILWLSATDVFGDIRFSQGKCLLGTLIVRKIRNIFSASSSSCTTDTTRPRPPNRPTRPAMCT